MDDIFNKPDCYIKEKDTPYPLCIGCGEEKCEVCNLYGNLSDDYWCTHK